MLQPGLAKKVTIYVGQDVRYHGEPLYIVLLNYLFYHGVSGATVTRGVAGFGADHHMHTVRVLELAENLPAKIEFIESPAKVEELLPKLLEMVGEGLVEIQDTRVLKTTTVETSAEPALPRITLTGRSTLMRILVSEEDRWRGKPLHEALVESLRANDIAGATVYRGIMGYGVRRQLHYEKGLARSHNRSIQLSVIDDDAKIRAFLPLLEAMIGDGLVVLSSVDVMKYTHRLPTPMTTEAQS